jgi:hypothetical protein
MNWGSVSIVKLRITCGKEEVRELADKEVKTERKD